MQYPRRRRDRVRAPRRSVRPSLTAAAAAASTAAWQLQLADRLRVETIATSRGKRTSTGQRTMSDHEVESVVVLPLPPRYRLKDLLLGEQHSEDDRCVYVVTTHSLTRYYVLTWLHVISRYLDHRSVLQARLYTCVYRGSLVKAYTVEAHQDSIPAGNRRHR